MYTKRQLFDACLKLANIDQSEFAKNNNIKQQMVSAVLNGKATSSKVQQAIDNFTFHEMSKLITHFNKFGLANHFHLAS